MFNTKFLSLALMGALLMSANAAHANDMGSSGSGPSGSSAGSGASSSRTSGAEPYGANKSDETSPDKSMTLGSSSGKGDSSGTTLDDNASDMQDAPSQRKLDKGSVISGTPDSGNAYNR